jgi:hypothetical protein
MTAASVHGVPITPALAAACRELLAGVASREAWLWLAPLVAESERRFVDVSPESDGEGKRHPPFGERYVVAAPSPHALASCALGSACARCSAPIESAAASTGRWTWAAGIAWWPPAPGSAAPRMRELGEVIAPLFPRIVEVEAAHATIEGEELHDGWCCSACVARKRELETFRRRAALWLRRGVQLGLFGAAPPTRRRRAR